MAGGAPPWPHWPALALAAAAFAGCGDAPAKWTSMQACLRDGGMLTERHGSLMAVWSAKDDLVANVRFYRTVSYAKAAAERLQAADVGIDYRSSGARLAIIFSDSSDEDRGTVRRCLEDSTA